MAGGVSLAKAARRCTAVWESGLPDAHENYAASRPALAESCQEKTSPARKSNCRHEAAEPAESVNSSSSRKVTVRTLVGRILGVVLAACALALPVPARAQGCVCQKQGGPVFGGVGPYLAAGKWQALFFYRGYESTQHFQGTEPFPALDANGPRNKQQLVTADLTWAASTRLDLSMSIPVFSNDFDVRRPPPGGGASVWVPIGASGLGDVNVRGRYWVLDPNGSHGGSHNLGLSLGVKLPTGKDDRTDDYFGRQVPVDVSIQTGDGSWGGLASLYAFQNAGPATLYASGH
jgi:hypothetical protein